MTDDRRPIATRELNISKRVASRLVAWGWSANGISVAGMIVGIAAGTALFLSGSDNVGPQWMWFVLGAAFVQLRLLANMLDGMVAIESGQASPVGVLYNEVPDRIADVAILIGFGFASGGLPTLGYLAALAAVFTAYVRAMIVSAGGPNDFCGPMAKPQRMFLVTVTALYCGIAPAGWQPTIGSDAGLPAACLVLITIGSVGTALRRLHRGSQALRGKVTP